MVELSAVEQRYQAVLAVIRDGVPVVEVARRFDVSRQAVHRWLRWYEAQGLVGLADRSHRPPRCAHQMDPAVEVWVLEARRRNPDWGPRRLVHEATRAAVEPLPSRSGVYRLLKRANLIDPNARRKRDRKFKRWERGGAMELWQMDVVGGVVLADGREAKVLTGIDDHSRFMVCAGLMLRAMSRAVCGHLAEAMRAHGVPQEILTDNGKVFTGRFGPKDVEVLFDRICRENGIDHLLTAPRSPTTTGKIERFHRTLRQEFLTGRVFTDLASAQRELDAWVDTYNRQRPHSALDMNTPASRFTADAGRPVDDSALLQERSGSDWVSRKIAGNGIISVAWQEISCGKHRAGRHVDIHLDGKTLQIWDGDELIKTVLRTSEKEVRKKHAQRAS
ncbi:MAG: IS481 family transposase [Actinomycetota bacterium]|nr:IS481 family transposase [Actinomycetota bacterium]